MREAGHNEIDTCSWVVNSVSQEEPAAAAAHGFLGHMPALCGFSMLCALVLLYYLLLWVLVFEIFSNCPGQPQSCSEAEAEFLILLLPPPHARVAHTVPFCALAPTFLDFLDRNSFHCLAYCMAAPYAGLCCLSLTLPTGKAVHVKAVHVRVSHCPGESPS